MDAFTIIKMLMSSWGISEPAVKFNAETQTIELRYRYQGQEQTKTISFQEAENFFKAGG